MNVKITTILLIIKNHQLYQKLVLYFNSLFSIFIVIGSISKSEVLYFIDNFGFNFLFSSLNFFKPLIFFNYLFYQF